MSKIKQIVLLTLISLTATQVMAEDLCDSTYEMADSIVDAMQRGITLPRMMEIAGDYENGKEVILDAYSQQTVLTSKESRSIFANKWYMICLKTDMGIK